MSQEKSTRKLVLQAPKAASPRAGSRRGHSQKLAPRMNDYRLDIETNQAGKYVVRIRVGFGRHGWELSAYFLVSSLSRAMKKLEQTLQQLQRHEDRLWFWGKDRSDDPNLAAELLKELGLQLDRRAEFPRKAVALSLPAERPAPAFVFSPIRRLLTESVSTSRSVAANH